LQAVGHLDRALARCRENGYRVEAEALAVTADLCLRHRCHAEGSTTLKLYAHPRVTLLATRSAELARVTPRRDSVLPAV
jgi:hypothetical protein